MKHMKTSCWLHGWKNAMILGNSPLVNWCPPGITYLRFPTLNSVNTISYLWPPFGFAEKMVTQQLCQVKSSKITLTACGSVPRFTKSMIGSGPVKLQSRLCRCSNLFLLATSRNVGLPEFFWTIYKMLNQCLHALRNLVSTHPYEASLTNFQLKAWQI